MDLVKIANRKLLTTKILEEIKTDIQDMIETRESWPIPELNKYLRRKFVPRIDSIAAVVNTKTTLTVRVIVRGASFLLKFSPNTFYRERGEIFA